ncbi:MAG: type II secretion system protein [Syntrophales bacterium]
MGLKGRKKKFPLIGGSGFTLLEVLISLAIVGGLLVTVIYTLNYHLMLAERQVIITTSTNLAKEKLYEMEKTPNVSSGHFPEPYSRFFYKTNIRKSSFPGISEIGVVVSNEKESVTLSQLIRR